MGNHTDASFKKEVIDAANNALHRYTGYEDKKFEDFVDVRTVSYNEIFEKIRKRIVEANKPIADFLSISPDILQGTGSVIEKISSLETALGQDNFMSTHAFDVLLYLTNVGEWVRSAVAEKILMILKENPDPTKINFLAHSLGGAVLHDSLVKLMCNGAPADSPHLDPHLIHFNSIWMVANVSRLLAPFACQGSVYHDIVQPGDQGCTHRYYNIRHELDPFTRPQMFNPQLSDNWVSPYTYNNCYSNIITTDVSRRNVHDIQGYIEDPFVSIPFLQLFMDFQYSSDAPEVLQGNQQFTTIPGEYKKLKDAFKHIDTFSELSDFITIFKDFKSYITKA